MKQLQRMINKTTKASNAFQLAQSELNDWCIAHYGFEPAERDVDGIIDSVFGGCGLASNMSAEEFDRLMKDAT